jgi:hypothetical protein
MFMRVAFFVVLLAAIASAQVPSATSPVACGAETTSFDLKTEKSQSDLVQPDPAFRIMALWAISSMPQSELGWTANGWVLTNTIPTSPFRSRRGSIACVSACSRLPWLGLSLWRISLLNKGRLITSALNSSQEQPRYSRRPRTWTLTGPTVIRPGT